MAYHNGLPSSLGRLVSKIIQRNFGEIFKDELDGNLASREFEGGSCPKFLGPSAVWEQRVKTVHCEEEIG